MQGLPSEGWLLGEIRRVMGSGTGEDSRGGRRFLQCVCSPSMLWSINSTAELPFLEALGFYPHVLHLWPLAALSWGLGWPEVTSQAHPDRQLPEPTAVTTLKYGSQAHRRGR